MSVTAVGWARVLALRPWDLEFSTALGMMVSIRGHYQTTWEAPPRALTSGGPTARLTPSLGHLVGNVPPPPDNFLSSSAHVKPL